MRNRDAVGVSKAQGMGRRRDGRVPPGAVPAALGMLFLALVISCQGSAPPAAPPGAPPSPPAVARWSADGTIAPGEYKKTMVYEQWDLHWSGDGQYIYAGLRAPTSGWVAIGIQPGLKMKDSDMVFGFVKDGTTTVYDLFSTGDFGPHPPDTELGGKYDILEFGGSEEGGYTVIEFKRAWDTGDSRDIPLHSGINRIIWSYGAQDGLAPKHTSRGYGELDLE